MKTIIEILIHQCKVILLKEKVGAYPSFLHPLYAKSREVGAFWSSWTCSAINASAIHPQCHLYHHMRHHHHCSFSWLPDLPYQSVPQLSCLRSLLAPALLWHWTLKGLGTSFTITPIHHHKYFFKNIQQKIVLEHQFITTNTFLKIYNKK